MTLHAVHDYHPKEELLNALTHGIGAVLAVIGTIALLIKGINLSWPAWSALWIYGLSLVILFSCSTLYHFSKQPQHRILYKKLDHIAIYYLIAGSYTPFLAIALPGTKSIWFLVMLWTMALAGTVFKLFLIHRFQRLSLVAYLVMGWLSVFLIQDMRLHLPHGALNFLIAGGLSYTVGALFYALKSVRYTHAIWHIFVLLGAGLQFLSIYLYVI